MKPTVGLTSRSGIIPISHSQDSPGPMTRSTWDTAMLLEIISGFDEDDSISKTRSSLLITRLSEADFASFYS